MIKLREQLEYAATAATLNCSRILPERAVYALAKGFALSFYAVSGRRRRLALRNTEIAFPEKPIDERKALVKSSYLNLAESIALNMLIMTNRISNQRLLDMVEADGWESFAKDKSHHPKGWVVITGHLGNWELISHYTGLRLDRKIHVVARRGNNRLLEERIVRPLRERFGGGVFYKKNALLRIVKAVHRGDLCGILIDQKLKPPEGMYINLFGKPAPTTPAAALLQVRFGIPVQPLFMIRTGRETYRLIIGKSIEWTDNGKPMNEQVAELAQAHQKIIEDVISQYPDQWFWAHNRWGLPKVKP